MFTGHIQCHRLHFPSDLLPSFLPQLHGTYSPCKEWSCRRQLAGIFEKGQQRPSTKKTVNSVCRSKIFCQLFPCQFKKKLDIFFHVILAFGTNFSFANFVGFSFLWHQFFFSPVGPRRHHSKNPLPQNYPPCKNPISTPK